MLHDLNSDHDRRHLNAGLAEELQFLLKRENGDVELSLRENKRLNHNAPMHELVRDANGKTKLVEKKHLPLMVSTMLCESQIIYAHIELAYTEENDILKIIGVSWFS